MGVFLFFVVAYLLLCYGLSSLFAKAAAAGADVATKEAWIPGLNFGKWAALVGRKPTYALWLLVPLVNVFIYAGLAVDLVRSFGKFAWLESLYAVLGAPVYFTLLGHDPAVSYGGPVLLQERAFQAELAGANERGETRRAAKLNAGNPYRKSTVREWGEAIVFAVAAAALIRLFVFEMYTIPTSSMEGSMLVGDYLLVSKAHYGIRTPSTVAMVPLAHNRLPFFGGESYLNWPQLNSHRLPALEGVDRNDPIVFNFPVGDSVYYFPDRTWSIEDVRYGAVPPRYLNAIERGDSELIVRPLDKKDHYVKRAVAVAGDTVEVRDRQLYINGEPADNPPHLQFTYQVTVPEGTSLNTREFGEWGISQEDMLGTQGNTTIMILGQEQIERLEGISPGISIEPFDVTRYAQNPIKLFPHDPENYPNWTVDNYGPVYIPKAGATVALTAKNIAMFRRVIQVYEGHDLREEGDVILIDGKPAVEYTFGQDYYWAMGDNRHNSEDSRVWGYVPADHIVGKPLFIWWSTKGASFSNGIRWNRIGMNATQMN